ncbi:hypothetical protein [Epilithonimonas sp.]|nr:hypothetical protein [Epilithonimonas sp.]
MWKVVWMWKTLALMGTASFFVFWIPYFVRNDRTSEKQKRYSGQQVPGS